MTRDMRYRHHGRAVEAWAGQALQDLQPPDMIEKCESILNELLAKIEVSVGAVTLAAVLDRVLYNSAALHPLLERIKLHENRLDSESVMKANLKSADIKTAFQHLMTELFSTIGNLTAETLTPQLHSALLSKKERA